MIPTFLKINKNINIWTNKMVYQQCSNLIEAIPNGLWISVTIPIYRYYIIICLSADFCITYLKCRHRNLTRYIGMNIFVHENIKSKYT